MSVTRTETAAELVVAQVSAVRIACRRITGAHLKALRDSVEQACRIPAAMPWDRKAMAHAEFFNALADVVGDHLVAPVLSGGAGLAYDLMAAAGGQAEAMILGSRRSFLAHLQTGDAEAAALEMERHLDVLYYMWHLGSQSSSGNATYGLIS